MTDYSALREAAEKAIQHGLQEQFNGLTYLAEYYKRVHPQAILALLDRIAELEVQQHTTGISAAKMRRLAAAERVIEAAEDFMRARQSDDTLRYLNNLDITLAEYRELAKFEPRNLEPADVGQVDLDRESQK